MVEAALACNDSLGTQYHAVLAFVFKGFEALLQFFFLIFMCCFLAPACKHFVRVVVMIVIPTHTIMLPLYMTFRNFDPFGLVSAITGKSANLMGTPYPMYIMTVLGCGLRSGLYIYIFNQFFRGLPKEIEEAALVDGAGTWYTYFFIMLRNAMPSVITVAVFSLVWQYNDTFYAKLFHLPQSMSIGTRISSLVANIANQYQIMDKTIQTLYLDAGIVLLMIPVVLIYVVLQKQFIEGVERSGIVG